MAFRLISTIGESALWGTGPPTRGPLLSRPGRGRRLARGRARADRGPPGQPTVETVRRVLHRLTVEEGVRPWLSARGLGPGVPDQQNRLVGSVRRSGAGKSARARADCPLSTCRHTCTFSAMTVPQAAALLGLSPATVRRQIANGRLRARKIGRDWDIEEDEVRRYRQVSWRRPGRRRPEPTLGLIES